jgi:hypothetical protein
VLSSVDVEDLVTELRSMRQRLASAERFVVELQLKIRDLEARPWPTFQGVWEPGKLYRPGAIVSWDGSGFICKTETRAKPATADPASRAWQLFVKRGAQSKCPCMQQQLHNPR